MNMYLVLLHNSEKFLGVKLGQGHHGAAISEGTKLDNHHAVDMEEREDTHNRVTGMHGDSIPGGTQRSGAKLDQN